MRFWRRSVSKKEQLHLHCGSDTYTKVATNIFCMYLGIQFEWIEEERIEIEWKKVEKLIVSM